MKKIIMYLLLFVAGKEAIASSFQRGKILLDTIYVSHRATTYLVFPDQVEMIDIGVGEKYLTKIEGQSVFIKAKDPTAPLTSLFIKYGDTYSIAMLAFTHLPKQYLYDFRNRKADTLRVGANHLSAESGHLTKIKARVGQLQTVPVKSMLKSRKRDNIRLYLSDVALDEQAIYLRLGVYNQSSMDFITDFIAFEILERKGKYFSSNNQNRKQRTPLLSAGNEKLLSGEKTTLVYVLPAYAMRTKSKLLITIKEINGARVLRLTIPARLLVKARNLDKL